MACGFFLIWRYFDSMKHVKFGVSGHFHENEWEEWHVIWHADESWPPSQLTRFFHGLLIFLIFFAQLYVKNLISPGGEQDTSARQISGHSIHGFPCECLEHPCRHRVMTQSHPTTGPVRFLSPVRFLARKAEWSARRNFTSVLFSWSHQTTGPVRLDTTVHLWFGRIIRRTARVPRAMPVRASCGPRTGILNVFYVLHYPYGARTGPARVPYGTRKGPVRHP